jgi:starch synthase
VSLQRAQLVCLGTGDSNLENGLRWLEDTYHDQARGWVGFNVPFSHRLTAGADVLLMPSRFEPCGLNQVYAMKYGTVPVAHATGGLKDTVITYNPGAPEGSTGWAFEGCTADSLKGALWQALKLYRCAWPASSGLARC